MMATAKHAGPAELRRLLSRERLPRRQTRLRAFLLTMQGRDTPSTAEVRGMG